MFMHHRAWHEGPLCTRSVSCGWRRAIGLLRALPGGGLRMPGSRSPPAAALPVRREHRECVAGHPDGHLVLAGQVGGWQDVAAAVLAGLDLVTEDPGELDVLG